MTSPFERGYPGSSPTMATLRTLRSWHQHARTQYDSAESTESAETFLEKTGLTRRDLEGKTVLDYGCGSGRFSEVATSLGARVVGLDLTSAVDVAAENLGDRAFAGVQADALNPPFKRAAFDVVFSIGVLHHTPDCRLGVKRAAGLVKPGGIVAIWVYWRRMSRTTAITDLYRVITKRLSTRALYSLCVTWVPRIVMRWSARHGSGNGKGMRCERRSSRTRHLSAQPCRYSEATSELEYAGIMSQAPIAFDW